MSYSNVRVVLVESSHPGNIGAVARAMKNMFLSRLYLVRPLCFPHAEATARASGADDILHQARLCDSLDTALEGCSLVLGASARSRRIGWPSLEARACGRRVAETARSEEVALLFGREKSGLTNEEIDRCNYLIHIPSNPEYSSLNLGAAVQVIAYEVAMAMGAGGAPEEGGEERADAGSLEGFYLHLEQTLVEIGFLDPRNPRQLMRRLRRLFNRAGLERGEVNILRGILTAAGRAAGRK